MILSEILSGVRLLEPLPPEVAALPVEGLDFDSRRVGPGFPFSTARDQNPQTVVAVLDPARIKRALDLWTAANSPAVRTNVATS